MPQQIKSSWFLENISESGEKWLIPIDKSPFIVGRSQDCNLSLLSKTVSRKHAEIYVKGNSLVLHDLESTNGTFINNVRLKDRADLENGDKINFGDVSFKILFNASGSKDAGSGTMYLKSPRKKQSFSDFYDLTKREEEILYLLLEGRATKNIADTLFISFGTAKNHITNLFKKINVHSKYELISFYNNFNSGIGIE
jgi:DNA-binding CsgD family transcriptional regulator